MFALVSASCGTSHPETGPPTPAANATRAPLLPTTVNALPPMDVAGFHSLLHQLRGTPVLVNIWASWCGPCVAEASLLSAAARSHPEVQFLGVDVADSRGGALRFLSTHGVPYPSVFDPTAAIKNDLGAFGQPDTYVYDASGALVASIPRALSAAELRDAIAKATAPA